MTNKLNFFTIILILKIAFLRILGNMTLSPKIKGLIIGAALLIAAIVVAVVVLVVKQKNNVVKVSSISFETANENMLVGEETQLVVSIYPYNAVNKRIQYWSSNRDIVEVVSYKDNKVTIRAKAIGEASIVARSVANKNLSDSCHISITDNVANAISVQASSLSSIGEETVVPITLEPFNANYQTLTVVSYDDTQIENPRIVRTEDGAQLVYTPIASGSSQLVLGINAQQGNKTSVVLMKAIEIVSTEPTISELLFKVKATEVGEFLEQEPNFLINENKTLYFVFSYMNGQDEVSIKNLNITYNKDIFSVKNNDGVYFVELNTSADFVVSNILFEYGGCSQTMKFVMGDLPGVWIVWDPLEDVDKDPQNKHQLKVGRNYLINISQFSRLIENGFMTIGLDGEYTGVELNGLVLGCNATNITRNGNNVNRIGFRLHINYWDLGGAQIDSDFYCNVVISSADYIEPDES